MTMEEIYEDMEYEIALENLRGEPTYRKIAPILEVLYNDLFAIEDAGVEVAAPLAALEALDEYLFAQLED